MPKIDISRNHSLGKDAMKTAVNQIIDRMSSSMGVKGAWSGDRYEMTAPAKGSFTVTDSNARVEIDLPMLMGALKGKIETRITEEFDKVLKK